MRANVVLIGGLAMVLAQAQAATAAEGPEGQKYRVYIGTYTTGGASRGIYFLDLDLATGALTAPAVAGESVNPSFLAIHPGRRFLYAVSEVDKSQGEKGGGVSAFAINRSSGTLSPLNQQSSRGQGPCFLTVDRTGKNVLVANYGSGSVACLPIAPDGRLQPASSFQQHEGSVADPKRQQGPHAHSINLDAANRFAVAADLGLDKLFVYRFDPAGGALVANDPPFAKVAPRSGPRHFAFHPDGKHAYVINEISLTVTAFTYDPQRGALEELQTLSTLPEGTEGKNLSTAEVQVHPSGRFLYGSNRGHNSIAIFAIDPASGRLRMVGNQSTLGKTPRNFGIDPSGHYLLAANQDPGNIVVFRIDEQTGLLHPTGQKVDVPRAVCVKFLPLGD
jgi:6-phosphogluconolactonase